jgi:hypothetical protein
VTGELVYGPLAEVSWNSSTDTYVTTNAGATKIHTGMRRCVMKANGEISYYLDASDSTTKAGGGAATLTGADGYVMVEIPKFYYKHQRIGDTITIAIADAPIDGFALHPAFLKDNREVEYRYISAYDACYLDATDSTYKSGLNLDDMTSNIDVNADKLASVSGVYPLVGVTRDECRKLAANNGPGWRVVDFWLTSAVQMLFFVEHGSFYSQNITGAGNTNGGYIGSSSNQSDSPHTIAGASNSLGNGSTNTTTGAGVNAKPGTSFMSYRGIENFYGNCWNWVDGVNIGINENYTVYVSNITDDFNDDVDTNYVYVANCATGNGFVQNIANVPGTFIPVDTTGASSSTFLTDQFFINTGNRVARFGGNADVGADAGAFCWRWSGASAVASRAFGARVAY